MSGSESDSFFEKLASGSPVDTREVYRFEFNRLHSFTTWPQEAKAYPTSLARVGLYYLGTSDTVACFHCNVHLGQWEEEDLPLGEHERHSPNCGFVRGQDVGNIPLRTAGQGLSVGEIREQEDEIRNRRAAAQSVGLGETTDGGNSGPNAHVMDLLQKQLSELALKYPFSVVNPLQRRPKPPIPQLVVSSHKSDSTLQGLTLHGTSTGSLSSMNAEAGSQAPVPSSIRSDAMPYTSIGSSSPQLSVRQQQINQAIVSITTEAVRQGLTEYCPVEKLKSIMQSANHPQYAHINRRIESFATWPYSHVQSPIKLAQAGFYYTGREDRIRCFLCNGGLCNWEEEDIPWYEHCRWFERCRYAMACRENPVVAAIVSTATQLRAAATSSSGETQCDEALQTGNVHENPQGSLLRDEAGPQSLRGQLVNMGYAEDRIRKVIQGRENNPTLNEAIDALEAMITAEESGAISMDSPCCQQGAAQAAVVRDVTGAASADVEMVDVESRGSGGETKDENSKKKKKKNKKKKGKKDGDDTAAGASGNIEEKTFEDLNEKETTAVVTAMDEALLTSLQKENEALRSRRTCKVCMEKEVCIVFLPCSHLVCCLECAMQLNNCPMCRGPIKATVKVFI